MASESTPNDLSIISTVLSGDDKTVETLEPVLPALHRLAQHTTSLIEASTKVWIASRDESWRLPLGESGILSFFQGLFPRAQMTPELLLNVMRIVANSCADRDRNRQRVVDHELGLKPVVELITNEDTQAVAMAVIWNICNDYEPAQEAAIKHGAVQAVFQVLSQPDFDDDLGHLVRLLELLVSHDSGKEIATISDLETVINLLLADPADPNIHGFDNTLNLLAILASLLSREAFQEALITSQLFPRVFEIFTRTYSLAVDADSERKDKSLIAYARQQLTEPLTAASTNFTDSFLTTFPLTSPFFAALTQALTITPGREDLASIACVLIGNLARSDAICTALVQRSLHVPLIAIITTTTANYTESITALRSGMAKSTPETTGAMAVGVLHSAVGVLKNLAIAQHNKTPIAEAGAFPAICEMLRIDGIGAGQVYYSAVSLARLLIVNNAANARLLLDGPEPLLKQFFSVYEKVEEPPTKTEISRSIAAVLRIVYGTPGHPELLPLLIACGEVERMLWDMVLNEKFAAVRGEGWFALALLARGEEGAKRIAGILDEKVVREGLGGMKGDRENIKVLLVQLKQAELGGEAVDELLKKALEEPKEGEELKALGAPESRSDGPSAGKIVELLEGEEEEEKKKN